MLPGHDDGRPEFAQAASEGQDGTGCDAGQRQRQVRRRKEARRDSTPQVCGRLQIAPRHALERGPGRAHEQGKRHHGRGQDGPAPVKDDAGPEEPLPAPRPGARAERRGTGDSSR